MGRKRKSKEQFAKELSEITSDIEIVGEYETCRKPLLVRCKIDGHEWSPTPTNLQQGAGCPECAYRNKTRSHDEFVAELKHISPTIEVLGTYLPSNAAIRVRCTLDGHEWDSYPINLFRGHGCQLCYDKRRTKEHDAFVAEMAAKNPNIEIIGEYVDNKTSIEVKCRVDGYIWNPLPMGLSSGSGCPMCAEHGYQRDKDGYFYIYEFDDAYGFGVTNSIEGRDSDHRKTFRKHDVSATLLTHVKSDGETIWNLESRLKKTLPIYNTGIEGFKTEAILKKDGKLLFDAIAHLQ